LSWNQQRHPAEILGVSENTIWTSFPPIDLNTEDLGIDVQLGGSTEGPLYHTQVVIGPRNPGDGIVLRRTASAVRVHGRDVWRVPTRLRARYGAGDSAPWFDGTIANLSLQGALLAGTAEFRIGDHLAIDVGFKSEVRCSFPGMVVHTNPPDQFKRSARHWFGVRFDPMDAQTTKDLTWYLWKRVRRLYPDEVRALYPRRKKRKKRVVR
jgi:hypothetical protein